LVLAQITWLRTSSPRVAFGGHIDGRARTDDVERELPDVGDVLDERVFGSTNSNG
jgi:hypothetical protein